jgi:hypothetical protein
MGKITRKDNLALEDGMNFEQVINLATYWAKMKYDGHFTLLSFTTGFKFMFGTPDLDSGEGREEVQNLKSYGTPEEAVYAALEGDMSDNLINK